MNKSLVLSFTLYLFSLGLIIISNNFNFYWLSFFVWISAILIIPVCYSLMSILYFKFNKNIYYLIYPFILLFLCLYWLIDPRYYLIPLTFFILFKKEENLFIEISTVFLYIIISALIFFGTINGLFFI